MDLMLLGWCVGSGASIHEDALYGRLFSDLYGKTISGSFSTAYGWIFPTFSVGYFDDGTGLNTYHAGSGMLYGLALAAALLLYTRFKASLLIIPATWVYATLGHSIYTYQINNGVSAIGYLTLGGYAIAIILVLAVPTALIFDYLRRRHITLRMPAIGVRAVVDAWRLGPTFIARVLRVIAVGRYHRGRNGAINAVWRDGLEHPDLRSISKWAVIAFIAAKEPLTDQETHPAYTQPPVPPQLSHDGPQPAPAEDGYGYIAPPHGTDTQG